jgi:hypothetical protein
MQVESLSLVVGCSFLEHYMYIHMLNHPYCQLSQISRSSFCPFISTRFPIVKEISKVSVTFDSINYVSYAALQSSVVSLVCAITDCYCDFISVKYKISAT